MNPVIRRNTPEEEAAIQRGIDADPDAQGMTEEEYATAQPAPELLPAAIYDDLTTPRGPGPCAKPRKAQVMFRLDQYVVDGLQATGLGWQSRANEALRKLAKD